MRNSIYGRIHYRSLYRGLTRRCFSSSVFSHLRGIPKPGSHRILDSFKRSLKPTSDFSYITLLRNVRPSSSIPEQARHLDLVKEMARDYSDGEVEPIDLWEEEDEAEPEVGDGGDGGGVVLQNCTWGERALSIAKEVLVEFGEDMELYAFKTSPRGYIYVRLDKLPNQYGCPSMEEIESFSRQYKKKLDEVGAGGEIPDDLALEVSSPGADRLLRVPDDLLRFKDMRMVVSYLESSDTNRLLQDGVYFLDSIETESRHCVWKLADVRENRDPSAKGRPLSRKQKDCRLKLSYDAIKRVALYISY